MDYKKHYILLIEKAKTENRKRGEIYYELHHIIPKSEGGSNKKENLVLLTAREHFIAHWLLYRMDKSIASRAHSFWRMCRGKGKVAPENWIVVSSRTYEEARVAHSKAISSSLRGRKKSPEHVAKVAAANTGKIRDEKARNNMREAAHKRGIAPGFYLMHEAAQKANRKPVLRLDPLTLEVLERYEQLKDAANQFSLHPGNISVAIKKGTKSGGFRWKFEN